MTLGGKSKFWIVVGALFAALSVGLGAFGAHGLKGVIAGTFVSAEQDKVESTVDSNMVSDTDTEKALETDKDPETEKQYVNRRLENWNTGARYQMYHALGLIFVGLLYVSGNRTLCKFAAILFSIGIVLFSGMLYVLVLTNIKILGAIVPLGGLSFILGWLCFALAIGKGQSNEQ